MVDWLSRFLQVALVVVSVVPLVGADALESGFATPSAEARPQVWWHWMDGNVSREGITADLEAMKAAGIGGAHIFNVSYQIPRGKVEYMSEEWQSLVQHALKEAERLGIEIGMHNTAGWSSSGAPWVKPQQAMQMLVWKELQVSGPRQFAEKLPQPEIRVGYYRDVAVLAYPTPRNPARVENLERKIAATAERKDRITQDTLVSGDAVPLQSVVDLTSKLSADGTLEWEVPEGNWTIVRIGHTPTGRTNHPAEPAGRGFECDKLSREGMDVIWAGMPAKVIAAAGRPRVGKTLTSMTIDSYEVGSQNWTATFPEKFAKLRGYEMKGWMAALTGPVVESGELTERFLEDFRRTIADLYAQEYFGRFEELCRDNGIAPQLEPYGNGPFEDLQAGARGDVAMGEFWISGWVGENIKQAATLAHTRGKRFAAAESFTAEEKDGRWLVDPAMMKPLGDLAMCMGLNRVIVHRYCHQPWLDLTPGMTMGPWGMHFERTITWWKQARAWSDYTARCQQMLQAGTFVADVLYVTDEHAPQGMPSRGSLRPELPPGYDFDVCSAELFVSKAEVVNGRVTLGKGTPEYRVLVLPHTEEMSPAVLRKAWQLARDGATIVANARPERAIGLSGYPAADEEVRKLVEAVGGGVDAKAIADQRFGNGRLVWGVPLKEILGTPDVRFAARTPATEIGWIHRRTDNADIYFVANRWGTPADLEATFRVEKRSPELWNPMTGERQQAVVFTTGEGVVTMPLHLGPTQSLFVVFREAGNAGHLTSLEFASGAAEQKPGVKVIRASYGARDKSADITARAQELVDKGMTVIRASNTLFGDPAPMVVKEMSIEWERDGKRFSNRVRENQEISLAMPRDDRAYDVRWDDGRVELVAFAPGELRYKGADGKAGGRSVERVPAIEVIGPWSVKFPAGWDAPAEASFEKLVSWTERPEAAIRYFSGTAVYSTSIVVPREWPSGSRLYLDLGEVKNIAEVKVNGKQVATLWTAPFRVDVTEHMKTGPNELEISLTNLWPNRLIGDEQLPDDCEWEGNHLKRWPQWLLEGKPRPSGRKTFASWRFYAKDSPLLESGLIGPVTLRGGVVVRLP